MEVQANLDRQLWHCIAVSVYSFLPEREAMLPAVRDTTGATCDNRTNILTSRLNDKHTIINSSVQAYMPGRQQLRYNKVIRQEY